MWEISNQTPFKVNALVSRDRNGAEILLVVARGTFAIDGRGALDLSDDQSEPAIAPKYLGDSDEMGLLWETDFVATKLRTDIVLHGHAYAPGGKPANQFNVGLKVGTIKKILSVQGDRYWTDFGPSDPKPFAKMPITYKNAYGGTADDENKPAKFDGEMRNPIGTGFAVRKEQLVGNKLPNIEYPDQRISHWRQRPAPAGFGPICRNWVPRIDLAGTYDSDWKENRQPLVPLDFQDLFYQSAPLDQQSQDFLVGGEAVDLRHLTPEGVLQFKLPRVSLAFIVDIAGSTEDVAPTIHSVILLPDVQSVTMVWHAAIPCQNQSLKVREIAVFERDPDAG